MLWKIKQRLVIVCTAILLGCAMFGGELGRLVVKTNVVGAARMPHVHLLMFELEEEGWDLGLQLNLID